MRQPFSITAPRVIRAAGIGLILAAMAGALASQERTSDYPVETIMYASFGPNRSELYIADGDGQNIRGLLSKPVFDYNPSLSADGRWVTFTSERDGSPDIYRVHPDGTGLERLTDDPAYDDRGALSPDGGSLIFVSTRGSGNANIWLLDLGTRKLKNLTAGSIGDYRPAWSPDGSLITFSSIRDATPMKPGADPAIDPKSYTTDIYLMRRDGTAVRRLTHSGSMFNPSWSLDGRRIVCVDRNVPAETGPQQIPKIVSIDVADGQITVLKEVRGRGNTFQLPELPQWVSASRVAYVTAPAFGFTDGDVEFSDGAAGPKGEFGGAHWSGDGHRMVFHRVSDVSFGSQGESSPLPVALRSVRASSAVFGSPVTFKLQSTLDPHFKVMRTGQFPSSGLLGTNHEIVMNEVSETGTSIIAVSPDGTSHRSIFDDPNLNAQAPAISPDGDEIAFGLSKASTTPGVSNASHIALVRADGSGLRELTSAGENLSFPSWSPDRASIVCSVVPSARGTSNSGLRIIDLQSGRATVLTTGPDSFPSWSPLGDRIVFARSPKSAAGATQIYTIKPDGSGLTRLTLSPGAQDVHPSWSPDGRWIAFSSSRTHPRDENLIFMANHASGGQLFVMRPDGTDVRQLTDTPAPKALTAWLPAHRAR